jgi:uncharacterized protein (TIGR03437 family)
VDFPNTPSPCQPGFGGRSDGFLTAIDIRRGAVIQSAFLGGREEDSGQALALGAGGAAYVAGRTTSANFPTTQGAFRDAYASGYEGGGDAFVVRIDDRQPAAGPCITLNGAVSAASFLVGKVSPGEIISIFGAGLGPAQAVSQTVQNGRFGTALAGTRVLFDGQPAPVLFTSSGQVNAIVPYVVSGKSSATVQVEYQGVRAGDLVLHVVQAAPAIFSTNGSGRGGGAILNQDYSVNSPARPAARGSVIQIFATGEGQTNPGGVDGMVAGGSLPAPLLRVAVTVGGIGVPIWYAGAAPGLVAGLIQVNAYIPMEVAPGSAVPVTLTIGGVPSPTGITLAVR